MFHCRPSTKPADPNLYLMERLRLGSGHVILHTPHLFKLVGFGVWRLVI